MPEGYIKLWRKSLDSQVWGNPDHWRFWTWCLMKATHQHRIQVVGNQQIELSPGQFIFGRFKAMEETGLSVQKIRTSIEQLSKRRNLTIKSTNKYSIISIVNWKQYQEEITIKTTNKQPTNNQQITTNKNVKNVKNNKKEKKEPFEKRVKDFSEEVMGYSDKYTQTMLEAFITYWTEPDLEETTKKELELQKKNGTWSTSGRLSKWCTNQRRWHNEEHDLSKVERVPDPDKAYIYE